MLTILPIEALRPQRRPRRHFAAARSSVLRTLRALPARQERMAGAKLLRLLLFVACPPRRHAHAAERAPQALHEDGRGRAGLFHPGQPLPPVQPLPRWHQQRRADDCVHRRQLSAASPTFPSQRAHWLHHRLPQTLPNPIPILATRIPPAAAQAARVALLAFQTSPIKLSAVSAVAKVLRLSALAVPACAELAVRFWLHRILSHCAEEPQPPPPNDGAGGRCRPLCPSVLFPRQACSILLQGLS